MDNINQKIDLVYLFGSTATGAARHAKSDVDIAYLSKETLSLAEQSKLAELLANDFHVSSNAIDLVNLANASPLLQNQVAREGKLLYGSPELDDNFYRAAIKKYIDTKSLRDSTAAYVSDHAA